MNWRSSRELVAEILSAEAASDLERELAIEEAKKRATLLGDDDDAMKPPARASAPATIGRRLVIVDNFSLSMLDLGEAGGVILDVRQISKIDAQRIAFEHGATVAHSLPERSMQLIERQLQIPPIDRMLLQLDTMFLCVVPVRWDDVRFYLVHVAADGDGVIP